MDRELRILHIEDVAQETGLIAFQLKRAGVRFTIVRLDTEPQFLDVLRSDTPDLILSDFSLPQFDGMSALRLTKAMAPEIPFIFVSGTIGEERAIEALKLGAADYVLKTNLARLGPAVTRALEQAALRRAAHAAEEQVRRLTHVLEMLGGINAAAMRIRDRSGLLREVCHLAVARGGYAGSIVTLIDPHTGIARPVAWESMNSEAMSQYETKVDASTSRDTTIAGRVLRTGSMFVCNDLQQLDADFLSRGALLEAGYSGIIALPLSIDATPIGVLTFSTRNAGGIGEQEIPLLREVAANLSFALQYLQKDDAVQFLSYFDPLTGLARRPLFCERLEKQLQGDQPAAHKTVVVLDIERLGMINDAMGRHIGDLLLQSVADRFKRYFGDTHCMAYFGSGTFALNLLQADDKDAEARAVHSHVVSVLGTRFKIEGHDIPVAARFGIARYPKDGREANDLLAHAEAALREAKQSGEQYLHRRLQVTSGPARQLALEHGLRGALENQQFVLHYQPKVDIGSRHISGVEALLRWNDPTAGLVFPGDFLPILESTGMIVAVGQWVLQQAVLDCQRWQKAGLPPMRIAVNVSPLQLRRREFAAQFLELTRSWTSKERGIDIEITEGTLHDDSSLIMQNLNTLRGAGVPIAIDDFGTGYSSLSRLSRLPVDTLKIDRSFIKGLPSDPVSKTLVSMIIGLAHTFGMTTVAEGVETEAQFEFLRHARCGQSQGYLHCKPIPSAEVEALLRAQASRLTGEPSVPSGTAPSDAA